MTRLEWGQGPRLFDMGVDHGVLYLDGVGVPWNGLVSVDEKPSGSLSDEHYFDGVRLHVSQESGDYEAAVSAYTYPDAFAEYNGWSEREVTKRFGFSYRTRHGNDYKVHLVYNVLVRNDTRAWSTMTNRAEPSLFSWDISAAAIDVPGARPGAHLTMEVPRDSTVFGALEDMLYGTDTTDPHLPTPAELIELYESTTQLRIIYHGDGSYSAIGPDEMVQLLDEGRFALNAPSVFLVNQDIFVVDSY